MQSENYRVLVDRLRTEPLDSTKANLSIFDLCIDASEAIVTLSAGLSSAVSRQERMRNEMDAMRNELCLKCGNYMEAHTGVCNGCRWKEAAQ